MPNFGIIGSAPAEPKVRLGCAFTKQTECHSQMLEKAAAAGQFVIGVFAEFAEIVVRSRGSRL